MAKLNEKKIAAWNEAMHVKYETTAQDEADQIFENKVRNAVRTIEVFKIYRHKLPNQSEWLVYEYRESAVTNLNNLEMNTPDPAGIYYIPIPRKNQTMTEEGTVKEQVTEIRKWQPVFDIPYEAEKVLEIATKIVDPYEVEFVIVPPGGMNTYQVPRIEYLAYCSFETLIEAGKTGIWSDIDIEKEKIDYQERVEQQRIKAEQLMQAQKEASIAAAKAQSLAMGFNADTNTTTPIKRGVDYEKALARQMKTKPTAEDTKQ